MENQLDHIAVNAIERGHQRRIAELEGRLRIWRDDYARSADGTCVTIPVHQLVELLGEPDLYKSTNN